MDNGTRTEREWLKGVEEPCDGSSDCQAKCHVHGCYADEGNCDEAAEHYDVEGVMA